MADQPDKSEKTEEPTEHKLEEAHKKGDVAKSQEVTTWFMILASALMFSIMAPFVAINLMGQLKVIIGSADQFQMQGAGIRVLFDGLAGTVLVTILVPLALMALFAVAANLIQHKPVWSFEPIVPKFSKISPLAGAKRMFSSQSLVNFSKGVLNLSAVGGVIFIIMWAERDRLETMMTLDPWLILGNFQILGIKVFVATLAIVTIVAVSDFMYQRHQWWEKQKMTIKEVRDEHKSMEGDPQIKQKIRQIRSEKSRKRMMAAVPEATVVITNPTHFAVALKYDKDMNAPICVAKGADAVAFRIRTLAGENDVPIVENPPLARALFASVELDETVPTEHFRAVAQVIGYVMQLKNKSTWRSQ
ncbi:MAG: flagellar biosynthesis protein FlhB [Devosiaceae bacterium]|nr:flagellar biosynthesis protein FlhB [Devosiaceae bacterium]